MQKFRYLPGVSTLKLNREECIGCGLCKTVCPHQVLILEDKKAAIQDLDGCIECGACAANCPVQAISVTPGVGCVSYIIKRWLKGKDAVIECC